jgi:hypothetical protein
MEKAIDNLILDHNEPSVVLVRRKKCSLMYDPVKQLMLNFDAN